jgi:hypothetical protein
MMNMRSFWLLIAMTCGCSSSSESATASDAGVDVMSTGDATVEAGPALDAGSDAPIFGSPTALVSKKRREQRELGRRCRIRRCLPDAASKRRRSMLDLRQLQLRRVGLSCVPHIVRMQRSVDEDD